MYMCVYIRASMCVCFYELPIFRSSSKSEITMAILSNKVDFSCSNNEITLKMKNVIVLIYIGLKKIEKVIVSPIVFDNIFIKKLTYIKIYLYITNIVNFNYNIII